MRKIKKGDQVVVVTGKDKGKRGAVLRVFADDRVLVENVNMVKRHTRPNPNRNIAGGIMDKEAPIHISNVALFNSDRHSERRFRRWKTGARCVISNSGEVADAQSE